MEKRKVLIAVIAISIIIAGFISMKGLQSLKKLPQRQKPMPPTRFVTADSVKYSTIDNFISEYGRIESANSIELTSQGQGTIHKGDIALKTGANFKKGQIIYKIDDTQVRLSLQASKSGFMTKLASVLAELKVHNPDRHKIWSKYAESVDYTKPLPKLPEFSDSKEKMFFASRGVTADYYNILVSEDRLSKYTYKAPFNGSYAEVYIDEGATVNTGTRIGKIVATDYYEMTIPISEKEIKWIKSGQGVIIDDEFNKWAATVLRIGDVIDPQTQSITVTIGIPAKGAKLYDGQYLKATIEAMDIPEAMVLPRKALFDGNHAWLIENNKLVKSKLEIVRTDQVNAYIKGPEAGSMLVNEPITNAIAGMSVSIVGLDQPIQKSKNPNTSQKVGMGMGAGGGR